MLKFKRSVRRPPNYLYLQFFKYLFCYRTVPGCRVIHLFIIYNQLFGSKVTPREPCKLINDQLKVNRVVIEPFNGIIVHRSIFFGSLWRIINLI